MNNCRADRRSFVILLAFHHFLSFASSFSVYVDPTRYCGHQHGRRKLNLRAKHEKKPSIDEDSSSFSQKRRNTLLSIGSLSLILPQTASAVTLEDPLEAIAVGKGRWIPLKDDFSERPFVDSSSTAIFCTYATRFLIRYDRGVQQWWYDLQQTSSLLSPSQRQEVCQTQFGAFAKSLQNGFEAQDFSQLWDQFHQSYALNNAEAEQQLLILFALLPSELQPVQRMDAVYRKNRPALSLGVAASEKQILQQLSDNLQLLLPSDVVRVVRQHQTDGPVSFELYPPPLLELSMSNHQTLTAFGPISIKSALTRVKPIYGWETYAMFGLSGASGCALTHSLVGKKYL